MIYLGIDIGGMSIKGIALGEGGEALAEGVIETGAPDGGKTLCNNVAVLVDELIKSAKCDKKAVAGIGVGCPGMIDSNSGTVVFAGNLKLNNFPLGGELSRIIGLPVKVTNDANAAALGEAKFGAGKEYNDSVLVTLGTGVGGGIVAGGKLFEGGKSAGTEIGHTVIVQNGLPCTCGRRGCLEAYASARALMAQTRAAMEGNRDSKMWTKYALDGVSGATPFEFADSDETAKQVVDDYVGYLACGLVNIANVFRPEVIMLGGGVSRQGERLIVPLQALMDKEIFAGQNYAPVKIVKATLGERAGAYGASALFAQD